MPVPLVTVIAPVAASTEHAVDPAALKLYAPVPLPPAAMAVPPASPKVASLGAETVTTAWAALLIVCVWEAGDGPVAEAVSWCEPVPRAVAL